MDGENGSDADELAVLRSAIELLSIGIAYATMSPDLPLLATQSDVDADEWVDNGLHEVKARLEQATCALEPFSPEFLNKRDVVSTGRFHARSWTRLVVAVAAEMIQSSKTYQSLSVHQDRTRAEWMRSFAEGLDYDHGLMLVRLEIEFEEELRLIRDGKGNEPSLPFGLQVDYDNYRIRREGKNYRGTTIDWSNASEKWSAWQRLVDRHPENVPSEDLGGTARSRTDLKSKMNDDLQKLDIQVISGKWKLQDKAASRK